MRKGIFPVQHICFHCLLKYYHSFSLDDVLEKLWVKSKRVKPDFSHATSSPAQLNNTMMHRDTDVLIMLMLPLSSKYFCAAEG